MILAFSYVKKFNKLRKERGKFRLRIILVEQVLRGIIDLIRVISMDLLKALIINGIKSRVEESRILKVLKFLPLENFGFQTESGCLRGIVVFQLYNNRTRFLALKLGIMEIKSVRLMKIGLIKL